VSPYARDERDPFEILSFLAPRSPRCNSMRCRDRADSRRFDATERVIRHIRELVSRAESVPFLSSFFFSFPSNRQTRRLSGVFTSRRGLSCKSFARVNRSEPERYLESGRGVSGEGTHDSPSREGELGADS